MTHIKQKYVRLSSHNSFIIFSNILPHNKFQYDEIVSAGFCYVMDNKVLCFGESTSLKIKSHDDDSYLATKQLFGIHNAEKLIN